MCVCVCLAVYVCIGNNISNVTLRYAHYVRRKKLANTCVFFDDVFVYYTILDSRYARFVIVVVVVVVSSRLVVRATHRVVCVAPCVALLQ